VAYCYDSRNALSWLVNPFAERTTWLYDALGRVTTMTHGNLSVAEHDYNAGGRLTALRNLKSDRSVISIFSYTYDALGNRTGVGEGNGDIVTWSYDPTYQLTREQRSGANAYDTTFTYDGVGNRLTQVASGATTTYVYDAANELTTSEDDTGVATFTYDANGNTAGEIRPNGDRVTYTWDIENHLTKVELPSAVVNTVTLDGDGKRRSIEDSDGLRNIIWDAENILAETDSGGSTVAQYTLAPEVYGSLVSQRRSGGTSFHHFDALGSTNKLTDADEATLIEYLYRAFGQQTIVSGSSANRFTWAGELGYYRESDPGDHWVRARVTSQDGHRFLSRASLRWPDEHPYNYCDDDPVNWIDPTAYEKGRKRGEERRGFWDWLFYQLAGRDPAPYEVPEWALAALHSRSKPPAGPMSGWKPFDPRHPYPRPGYKGPGWDPGGYPFQKPKGGFPDDGTCRGCCAKKTRNKYTQCLDDKRQHCIKWRGTYEQAQPAEPAGSPVIQSSPVYHSRGAEAFSEGQKAIVPFLIKGGDQIMTVGLCMQQKSLPSDPTNSTSPWIHYDCWQAWTDAINKCLADGGGTGPGCGAK